jgi:hypothetical protein
MQLVPPENVTSFYIIDRRQWESILGGSTDTPCRDLPVKKITIPREVSHFAVDYANPDGKITMYIGHNNGSDVTEWVQKYDRHFIQHTPAAAFDKSIER